MLLLSLVDERGVPRIERITGCGVESEGHPMTFEGVFSVAMLGVFIWAVRFMVPRAVKEHDALALTSAVLTAALALLAWLLVGVRVIAQFVN
jgi:hypothetical protein